MPYREYTLLLMGTLVLVGAGTAVVQAPVVVEALQGRASGRDLRRATASVLLAMGVTFALSQTLTSTGEGWSMDNLRLDNINLEPLRTVDIYLEGFRHGNAVAVRNLLGNLLLLAPVGGALAIHPRVRPFLVPVVLVATSSLIEVAQVPLGRSTDVDDVLLNTVGGCIAALLTWAVLALLHRRAR